MFCFLWEMGWWWLGFCRMKKVKIYIFLTIALSTLFLIVVLTFLSKNNIKVELFNIVMEYVILTTTSSLAIKAMNLCFKNEEKKRSYIALFINFYAFISSFLYSSLFHFFYATILFLIYDWQINFTASHLLNFSYWKILILLPIPITTFLISKYIWNKKTT